MAYCIMRVEKRKRAALYGLQIEANRTTADHTSGGEFVKPRHKSRDDSVFVQTGRHPH